MKTEEQRKQEFLIKNNVSEADFNYIKGVWPQAISNFKENIEAYMLIGLEPITDNDLELSINNLQNILNYLNLEYQRRQ